MDFLAPPGTGKTTLINAVLARAASDAERKTLREWISIEEARFRAGCGLQEDFVRRIGWSRRLRGFGRMLANATRGYLLGRGWGSEEGTRQQKVALSLLKRFLEEQYDFFSSVVDHGWDSGMPYPGTPRQLGEMIGWTDDWLFAQTCRGNVGIVADNARFTRAAAELLEVPNIGEMAERQRLALSYLESIYAPRGIVHLDGDAKLILDRVHKRRAVERDFLHPSHRGLNEDDLVQYTKRVLRVNNQAVEFIRAAGIPVLTIDASSSTAENARAVIHFLDSLTAVSLDRQNGDRARERGQNQFDAPVDP